MPLCTTSFHVANQPWIDRPTGLVAVDFCINSVAGMGCDDVGFRAALTPSQNAVAERRVALRGFHSLRIGRA